MGITDVITGLDALITLERKYGTTDAGRTMIDGITSDLLDVVPYPFQISFINLSLDREKMGALVTGIQGHIRTYVSETPPPSV